MEELQNLRAIAPAVPDSSFSSDVEQNPKNEFAWITGCLGIVPACSASCATSFSACFLESSQSLPNWERFATCEDELEAGRLAGCATGCAPTLDMLSLSEAPVVTLSEGRFGTTSGLNKHSADAPRPESVWEITCDFSVLVPYAAARIRLRSRSAELSTVIGQCAHLQPVPK